MNRRNLTCSCCGSSAGRWEQWPNRDTGYGLCAKCAEWLEGRGMSAEEMRRCYGEPGTHYEPKEANHA